MSDLKTRISQLIAAAGSGRVWVPTDFAQLGSRDAVDKTLQRLVAGGELRRIDRGLYDKPAHSKLTRKPNAPNYRAVVEAIARRDQLRLLVDGMTAANDLGLTNGVPARVTIHTDARRKSVTLDKLTIEFKQTAPSKLYWAGRPAMRVVQALHWSKDAIGIDSRSVVDQLAQIVSDPVQGEAIRKDLLQGFSTMPIWMQAVVRELPGCDPSEAISSPNEDSRRTSTARRTVRHSEVSR